MTKRLQILVTEPEFEQLRAAARASRVSVGEWVRRAIRRGFEQPLTRTNDAKLLAIREALAVYAPTADIEQMNAEIEQGYQSGLP